MPNLRAVLVLSFALCAGCGSGVELRVLSSEPATAAGPEPEDAPLEDETAPKPAPRIGPPGGSGSGARSVIPAQSGNEAVGGLPAGMGGGSGPRG
ncbi:MAG: hypothetical protein EOO73_29880 [Myxococcales bacterium]|nr:MAG: hypothetical protein EOO73_29880 [Myxococcales bacterium]